jgi:hypothetical protein
MNISINNEIRTKKIESQYQVLAEDKQKQVEQKQKEMKEYMKRMNIKLEEQKEIVKLYEISEQQNEIIKFKTNSENTPSIYIPPREKLRAPSRENFNTLYKIVDHHRHNILFSDRKK